MSRQLVQELLQFVFGMIPYGLSLQRNYIQEKKSCIKEKWHKSIPHSEDDKEFRKPFYDQLVLIQSIKKVCFRQCSEHS